MEGVSAAATELLNRYSWPGNIRELQNVIERAVILSHGSMLELENDLISVSVSEAPRDKVQAAEETQPATQSSSLKTLE